MKDRFHHRVKNKKQKQKKSKQTKKKSLGKFKINFKIIIKKNTLIYIGKIMRCEL